MSDLEAEIVKILREHDEGLSLENIQSRLLEQRRNEKNLVPDWVVHFALDSLRIKGVTLKRGQLWGLKTWDVA
jgi:hypothetical protein